MALLPRLVPNWVAVALISPPRVHHPCSSMPTLSITFEFLHARVESLTPTLPISVPSFLIRWRPAQGFTRNASSGRVPPLQKSTRGASERNGLRICLHLPFKSQWIHPSIHLPLPTGFPCRHWRPATVHSRHSKAATTLAWTSGVERPFHHVLVCTRQSVTFEFRYYAIPDIPSRPGTLALFWYFPEPDCGRDGFLGLGVVSVIASIPGISEITFQTKPRLAYSLPQAFNPASS